MVKRNPCINFSQVLTQQKILSIAYPLYSVFLPTGEKMLALFSEESKKRSLSRKACKGSHRNIGLLLGCVFIVFFHHFDSILKNSQIISFFFICKYMVKKKIYKAKEKHITIISNFGESAEMVSPSISHWHGSLVIDCTSLCKGALHVDDVIYVGFVRVTVYGRSY